MDDLMKIGITHKDYEKNLHSKEAHSDGEYIQKKAKKRALL